MKIYRISKSLGFHGSQFNIDAFKLDYVGKGIDQNGPGIYFTSNESDASVYGPYIYHVKLNFKKYLTNKTKPNIKEIKKLIFHRLKINNIQEIEKWNENDFYDSSLSDWGESPLMALSTFINSVIQYEVTALNSFLEILINLYKNDDKQFVEDMHNILGYDGVVIENNNQEKTRHYIVYNLQSIELVEKKKSKIKHNENI